MKKKLKSSWKIVSIALILALAVSILCMSGSALPGFSQQSHQSWSNLPDELPDGTVNYYAVNCKKIDGSIETVYLKILKQIDSAQGTSALNVYEANTLDGLQSSEISVNFDASYNSLYGNESWTVALKPVNEFDTATYAKILSVSPLSTTIESTQVWDGTDGGNYISVSNNTAVRYSLNDGNEDIKTFYVKKEYSGGQIRLEISSDGDMWSDNSIVFDDGKVINAKLNDSTGFSPEEWIITVTGYDRLSSEGKLIDYRINKKDVSGSQAWTGGDTELRQSFNGLVVSGYDNITVNYTLKLKEASTGTETDILIFEKTINNGIVTKLSVSGLSKETGDSSIVLSTITGAESSWMSQQSFGSENRIEFSNDSLIRLDDIMGSDEGVRIHFNIGRNNGEALLTLKLTESGKLSYSFENLPADSFIPDTFSGEGTPIAVDSYKVDSYLN